MAADLPGDEVHDVGGSSLPGAPTSPDPEGVGAGILELGISATAAERSSLWLVEPAADPEGGRILRRIHLHHAATGTHTAGGILREDRFPRYFSALDSDDLLVVDDVTSDPRTAELLEPYARPLGIQAWIDHRLRLPGGARAVLRFERGGPPRRWRPREVRMARILAGALQGMGSREERGSRDASPGGRPTERGYRRLLEHGRIGTLRLDPEGRVLDLSPGVLSLLGASSEEDVEGRSIGELLDEPAEGERLVSRLRDLDELPLEELRLRTGRDRVAWALVTAVRAPDGDGHLALLVDLTARKERERELERQAHFDLLTGLPNRRLLWQQASRLLALAGRQDRCAAVSYLDLIGFKEINDRHGHVAGDRILEAVGGRLEAALRESDVGARIGGDEFAVLLSDVDGAEGAREAARRILESINRPVEVGEAAVEVRARAGVALYPEHGRSLDELLDRADQAMYVAYSEDDAIPVEIFRASEAPPSPRPDQATRDLQRAVEDDEFVVHYQPIAGLPDGGFSGVEALIRWQHPRHGLLEPAAFLSDALQAGLQVEIDRWVLGRAIRQAACWGRENGPEWVSVNLSLPSLRDPALGPFLARELRQTGLEPRRLVLEISEPDLRAAGHAAVTTLSEARDLGIRLAADCRGSGPDVRSSLAELPVDLVKVELDGGRDGRAGGGLTELLVESGVPLLAGRIETEDDFARARSSVFAMAQGYYMSRPAPASEIRFRGRRPEPAPDDREGSGDPSPAVAAPATTAEKS